MASLGPIGIIGGTGALGGAIARRLLRQAAVSPQDLWISSRSGRTPDFDDWPGVNFTSDNQALADACDVVLLSIPPQSAATLKIAAENRLVLSVMAGVSMERLRNMSSASRIIRAMSSPAAEIGRAYSPWYASAEISEDDRRRTRLLFETCGLTDEVAGEDQIDRFTALTGPVPGFVAYFAACMADYAKQHGVEPAIADRAIRQLFLASGEIMSQSAAAPGEHVDEMIRYAGTTAAGLEAMQRSPLSDAIGEGLDAAYEKAKRIGSE